MNEGLRTWLDNQPDQQALQAQTDWQSLYALHQWAKIFTIVLLWITYVYDSDKIHISSKTFIYLHHHTEQDCKPYSSTIIQIFITN